MMKRMGMHMFSIGAVVAAAMMIASCGGGGSDVPGTTSAAVTALGTMTKGSVKAGNVHFVASATAKIRQEDNGNILEAQANQANEDRFLRNGMKVRVKGQINDNLGTVEVEGVFEKVKPEPEVRGPMSGKAIGSNGINSFSVNGRGVITDDSTVFEDRATAGTTFTPITFNDLLDLQKVEVHGGLDDLGNIRATRVERRNDNPVDEIRGSISSLVPGTSFILTYGAASLTVTMTGATVTPAGATFGNGSFVEVYGVFNPGPPATTFTATKVHVEDIEDVEFEPGEGQEDRVEGFVSGFANDLHTLQVGTTPVDASSATFFGGSKLDLINGAKVQAEGRHVAGTLLARKIEFKRSRIVLEGLPSGQTATQVTVAGKTALISSITRNTFTTGRMRIRGFENNTGSIMAERMEDAGGGNKDVIQGRVTATNGSSSLTLLGTAYTAGAATVYQGVNDNIIPASTFFSTVVPKSATNAGTLVKIKIGPATTTFDEAELEN